MKNYRAGDTAYARKLNSVIKIRKGEELRIRRVTAGLKQVEVARQAGMTQSRLSNYEKGVHIPNELSRQRVLEAIQGLRIPAAFNPIFGKFDWGR